SFERAMDRDERLMAILGSRLLENQKRVGETAQAIELRQSGENSILSNIATSVSESLTRVLRWAYWWHSFEEFPDEITTTMPSFVSTPTLVSRASPVRNFWPSSPHGKATPSAVT